MVVERGFMIYTEGTKRTFGLQAFNWAGSAQGLSTANGVNNPVLKVSDYAGGTVLEQYSTGGGSTRLVLSASDLLSGKFYLSAVNNFMSGQTPGEFLLTLTHSNGSGVITEHNIGFLALQAQGR